MREVYCTECDWTSDEIPAEFLKDVLENPCPRCESKSSILEIGWKICSCGDHFEVNKDGATGELCWVCASLDEE